MTSPTQISVEKAHWNTTYAEHKPDLIYGLPIPPYPGLHFWKTMKPLSGKCVLEIGCGSGSSLIDLANEGAEVWGIDVSEEGIRQAERLAGDRPMVHVSVADAHALPFPDEFADVIVGHGVLHHLELSVARDEIYRCLKPGGMAYFNEPLGYNPFINLFRKLTPKRRTETERPLRWKDIKFLKERFSVSHRQFFLLSLLAFPVGMLGLRRLSGVLFRCLYHVEHILQLDRILGRYCWMITLTLRKTQPATQGRTSSAASDTRT
jgi:SAM-dependent methyltransferase